MSGPSFTLGDDGKYRLTALGHEMLIERKGGASWWFYIDGQVAGATLWLDDAMRTVLQTMLTRAGVLTPPERIVDEQGSR